MLVSYVGHYPPVNQHCQEPLSEIRKEIWRYTHLLQQLTLLASSFCLFKLGTDLQVRNINRYLQKSEMVELAYKVLPSFIECKCVECVFNMFSEMFIREAKQCLCLFEQCKFSGQPQ